MHARQRTLSWGCRKLYGQGVMSEQADGRVKPGERHDVAMKRGLWPASWIYWRREPPAHWSLRIWRGILCRPSLGTGAGGVGFGIWKSCIRRQRDCPFWRLACCQDQSCKDYRGDPVAVNQSQGFMRRLRGFDGEVDSCFAWKSDNTKTQHQNALTLSYWSEGFLP